MEIINFSIVIPVHNRAHTLTACIDSILNQTYSNFELILVDDHSTDNSVEVIQSFLGKDSRIKLFIQPDNKKGAQAARNAGIINAQYDWIMFNDSDDTWSAEKIEKELNLLKELNFDTTAVIYSDCFTIDVNTKEKTYWALPHISSENSYKELLIQSGPMFQSLLCSKELLSKINNLDEAVPSYQEWDTSIRLAEYGKFYHIEDALFDYYIGSNDAMSKSIEKDFIGRSNILNKFKNEIIKFHGTELYNSLLTNAYKNARDKVDFKTLAENNSIISLFHSNLISVFGKNYDKKLNTPIKRSFIKRAFRFILRLPSRIWNKIKNNFTTSLTYAEKFNKAKNKYMSKVYFSQEGNDRLKTLLSTGKPVFVTRFGAVELQTLTEYLNNSNYSDNTYYSMPNNAGFFPASKTSFDKFSKLYFASIKEIDACGCWFNNGEAEILKNNVPNALLVELGCLNSFLFDSPYTEVLKGKKVLVIHPFVNTIKHQYTKNRKYLFNDERVLPKFELILIKAPQTIAENYDGYTSWFDAYSKTCKQIDSVDFDIALLGCGAYGLPLGAYIKNKGKTAIHIGGALQLLFGIMGKRWAEDYDYKDRFFNEYWTYPFDCDTPANSIKVENNCYWR